MSMVITPFWLFVIFALLAGVLGAFVEPVYLWITAPALAFLFSANELSIDIDSENVTISYLPPKTGEKGGV